MKKFYIYQTLLQQYMDIYERMFKSGNCSTIHFIETSSSLLYNAPFINTIVSNKYVIVIVIFKPSMCRHFSQKKMQTKFSEMTIFAVQSLCMVYKVRNSYTKRIFLNIYNQINRNGLVKKHEISESITVKMMVDLTIIWLYRLQLQTYFCRKSNHNTVSITNVLLIMQLHAKPSINITSIILY